MSRLLTGPDGYLSLLVTIMQTQQNFYITRDGLYNIKREYEAIKKKILAKKSEGAPRVTDTKEIDSEYILFWEEMISLKNRIFEIKNVIDHAVLIEEPRNKKVVSLGATVMVETDDHERENLTIVGTAEANLSRGMISNESPVGKSLIGHKINEEVKVMKNVYKIKGITYGNLLYN